MSKNVHSCFFHHCKQIWIVRCPFHIPDIFPFKTNQFAFFSTFFRKRRNFLLDSRLFVSRNIFFSQSSFHIIPPDWIWDTSSPPPWLPSKSRNCRRPVTSMIDKHLKRGFFFLCKKKRPFIFYHILRHQPISAFR